MAASNGLRLALGFLIAAGGSFVFAQATPPANPDGKLAQLAIDAAKEGAITPIPLDNTPGPPHGVLYDRFLLGVVTAKAALAAGRTPFGGASGGTGPAFVPPAIAVVAYARTCEGRASPPQDIRMRARLAPGPDSPVQLVRVVASGAAAKAMLPGVTLPAASMVVAFASADLTGAIVSIDYTEPLCPATLKTVDLTLYTTPARPVKAVPTAPMPPNQSNLASPATVRVQVVLDRDGSFKQPTLLEGPAELESAALGVIKQWQFEPLKTNGVARPQVMVLPVTFTTTGQPPTPPVMASSSGGVGGNDPTHKTTTDDVPGLDRSSSRCDVSDDPTYGVALSNPVKVGGDVRTGPAREVRYLNALRGPRGEGLAFRRIGSTMANQTILDIYEVTYDGLPAPTRLYLDEYHFEPLKAPAGFVCAAEFGLTATSATATPGSAGASGAPSPLADSRTVALVVTDDQPGLTSATSKCPVSDDDTYAVSAANAVRIGGGAEAVTREDQYMRALRGPGGTGLKFRRTGSMLAPDQKTIVDVFEVTYSGVSQPVRLYFDRTQADTLRAPKTWACVQEIK